jgi:hypothetical protein
MFEFSLLALGWFQHYYLKMGILRHLEKQNPNLAHLKDVQLKVIKDVTQINRAFLGLGMSFRTLSLNKTRLNWIYISNVRSIHLKNLHIAKITSLSYLGMLPKDF